MQVFLDTGILLRWFDRSDPAHADIRSAITQLVRNGAELCTAPQNLAEFWNVSTRPVSARGGYGRAIEETRRRMAFIESRVELRYETAASHQRWKSLLLSHNLAGVSVHDARLVAIMNTCSIRHLLTLNTADFRRYKDIQPITPAEAKSL